MLLHALDRWAITAGRLLIPSAHIGAYGVDLFFVISGFVVCNVAKRAPSARTFLLNRYIRVAPVYYMLAIPWIVIAVGARLPLIAPTATGLFFWPVWGSEPTYPVLNAGWTLCFEALFYCSLAAVIQEGRRAATALAIGYVAALALNLAGAPGVFRFVGSPLVLEFLLGAAIAIRPICARPRAGVAAVLAAGLLLAFWFVYGIGETWNGLKAYSPLLAAARVVMAGPPAFLLVWGALQLEPWCKGQAIDAFNYIGDASFSIYLTNAFVIGLVGMVWRAFALPAIGLLPVLLTLAIAGGVLIYRTVEQPVLAIMRRKPQPVALAAE